MGLPTTESHIARAEYDGHFSLPSHWKRVLLRSNGFTLQANGEDWDAFPVLDGSDRKHLVRSANHILRETETFRNFPHFPSEAIAIAANGTGDCLILLAGKVDVYVWEHETGGIEVAYVTYPNSDPEDIDG